MEVLIFLVVAVVLYFAADGVVRVAEAYAGRRFEYRTIYFFVVLLVLAVVSFEFIQKWLGV